jgi:hypothetical protein
MMKKGMECIYSSSRNTRLQRNLDGILAANG